MRSMLWTQQILKRGAAGRALAAHTGVRGVQGGRSARPHPASPPAAAPKQRHAAQRACVGLTPSRSGSGAPHSRASAAATALSPKRTALSTDRK